MRAAILGAIASGGVDVADLFRVVGRGQSGNDITADVNAAIQAASAAGGGTVFVVAGQYPCNSGQKINPRSNVCLMGDKYGTVFFATTDNQCIEGDGTAFSDFTVESMTFKGTATSFPTVPTRARTTSGAGTVAGIRIRGSLDPNGTVNGDGTVGSTGLYPAISNVTVKDCVFRNIWRGTSPPVLLAGIKGRAIMTGCEFYNTLDPGFIFCEAAVFTNNHVEMSADNGVSLSRGNLKVVCVGNTFDNIAYMGIWISGYVNQIGPKLITCTGNVVRNCGRDGIVLQDAPMYGVVTGNTIDRGWYRGEVDTQQNGHCCGIFVRGYPESAPSTKAKGLKISDNFIRGSGKAGIFLDSAEFSVVSDNLILDPGTQYLADGTTAILQTDVTQNIGIIVGTPVTTLKIRNNEIHDTRATKYANLGIYPSSVAGSVVTPNYWSGMRDVVDAA